MMHLDEIHYADLIGSPFELGGSSPATGLDCWELVRLICERRGIEVPHRAEYGSHRERQAVDPGWVKVTEAIPGDVIAYSIHGKCIDHVGVVTVDGMVIQATKGAGVCVYDRRKMHQMERGVYRPHSTIGVVTVATHTNVFAPTERTIERREVSVLSDYIPSGVPAARCVASVNGARQPWEYVPSDGDTVEVMVYPGDPLTGTAAVSFLGATIFSGVSVVTATLLAFVGNLLISFGIGFLFNLLTAPSKPGTDSGEADPSPTFRLDGIVNTTGSGGTIPIVFGTHRIGGHVVSAFNEISGLNVTYLPGQTPPGTPPPPYQTNIGPDSVIQNTNSASADGGKTTLNILIALSEGPIQSINGIAYDGENISASSLAPGTLLINGNDASSFAGVQMFTRLGSVEQYPITGFTDSTTGVSQDYPLRYLQPYTYTTTTDVQAFAIQMFEANGHYRTSTAGSNVVKRKHVQYQFKYRPAGQVAWTEISTVTREYTYRAPHSWQIRRDNLPLGKYEVSLERLTLNDDDPSFIAGGDLSEVSAAAVNAVNEITYDIQSFPGVAMMAVKVLASDQLSGPPTLTSLVEGVKCWHSADGTTWTEEFTSNPADIAQEVLLNKTWGLGRYIEPADMHFASFSTLRSYCADLIDDGRGGTANLARWTFDYVYDRNEKAADLLDRVLSACRASLSPMNGKVGVRIDTTSTPTHLFNEGSISDLVVSYLDKTDRPTRINVQFANSELDYDIDTISVEDQSVTSGEFREETIQAYGVTHPTRAYRIAVYKLNVADTITKVIRFKAGIDSLLVEPGDTFWIAHQELDTAHLSGRIPAETTTDEIIFDREMTIPVGAKVRILTNVSGVPTLVERTMATSGAYDFSTLVANVTSAWSANANPKTGDPWALGPSATYLQAYRCTAVQLLPDLSRQVEAVMYDATIYDDDPGTVPASTDLLINRKNIPTAATGVTIREENRVSSSGDVDNVVVVTWAPETGYDWCDVFFRDPDDTDGTVGWEYHGRYQNGRCEIHQIGRGESISVSVCPVSPNGTRRDPEQGGVAHWYVRGKLIPPADVTGFDVSEAERDIVFRWDAVADPDVATYEIRVGLAWICASHVVTVCGCDTTARVPIAVPRGSGVTPVYWIKARNTTGIYSDTAASSSYEWTGDGTFEAQSATAHTGWSGTKTNMSVSSGDLVSDAAATTIGYETVEQTVSGQKRHAYPTDLLRVKVNDRTALTWGTADFTWGSPAAVVRTWGGADFTDYPDTEQAARAETWETAGFTWGGAIAAGRTWGGLSPSFFLQTHESKENSEAAYASASFDRFVPSAPKLSSYGFKTTLTIPDDDYLVTFDDEYLGLYQRDLSRDGIEFDDPMFGSSTESGEVGILGWTLSGTGSTISRSSQNTSTHPGQYQITAQAVINATAGLNTFSAGTNFIVSSGVRAVYVFTFYVVDTTACSYVVGLTNSATSASPTRYIAFTGTAGSNWRGGTKDASGTTSTDMGVALAAGWHRGKITVLSTGTVKFELDVGGTLYTATNTTNITTDALGPIFLVATTAAVTKSIIASRFRATIENMSAT